MKKKKKNKKSSSSSIHTIEIYWHVLDIYSEISNATLIIIYNTECHLPHSASHRLKSIHPPRNQKRTKRIMGICCNATKYRIQLEIFANTLDAKGMEMVRGKRWGELELYLYISKTVWKMRTETRAWIRDTINMPANIILDVSVKKLCYVFSIASLHFCPHMYRTL